MTGMSDGDISDQIYMTRTVDTEFYYFAKRGQGYIVNPEQENASTGDTVSLLLRNPSGSDTTAVFAGVNSTAAARSYIRVYDTFDSPPTAGTSAVIDNVVLDSSGGGSPTQGTIEASTNPTFSVTTPGDIHISDVVGGGTGSAASSGSATLPILMLEPGRDAVVEIEKLASGPNEAPIRARWFEVPTVFSERTEQRPYDELYQ